MRTKTSKSRLYCPKAFPCRHHGGQLRKTASTRYSEPDAVRTTGRRQWRSADSRKERSGSAGGDWGLARWSNDGRGSMATIARGLCARHGKRARTYARAGDREHVSRRHLHARVLGGGRRAADSRRAITADDGGQAVPGYGAGGIE